VTAASDRPADLRASFARHTGTVQAFDEHGGWGVVNGADGGGPWYFHCTAIADGSRSIPVGAAVTYDVAPGPTGLEASALRPVCP
jgi:cold shock CspA family protein